MNIIKKTIKCILFITITFFLLLPFISNNKVGASEVKNYKVNIENFQNIDDLGYLYNLDGSPDYIYVDFIDQTGYAIFSEETLEILEYTNTGSFPYDSISEQKYYGGPYKYFVKINNSFKNILTNEEFSFSTDYIEQVSSFSRSLFNTTKKTNLEIDGSTAKEKISSNYAINICNYETTNTVSSPSSPPLDENNWIRPTGGATYIDNVEYFMTPYQAPRHGSNNGTSCTTVAIQLLLSYNNYYNDRRIIAPEHLFGDWNNGSSNIFDRSNYTTPDNNPNVCGNPNTIVSEIIGSNQAFHDFLFSQQITGFLTDAQEGLKDYLDNRGIDYDIECEMETILPFDWGSVQTIDSAKITSKIDEGKPVVISTEESLNGTPYTTPTSSQRAFNHSVIAYGYQTLAPYASSGNNNSYLGYIVHMGWDASGLGWKTNIWTNSSWYYSYLSIDINHNHNYNIVINNIINNKKIEIRCEECGHRKLDDLFVLSGNTITDSKYDLIGEITIPSNINGIEVKGIGSESFKNCRNLQGIIIPNSVEYIDSGAFENCIYLQSVTLSSNINSIGNAVFKGCASLVNITIPNTVTNIDSNAFENCTSLSNITLSNNLYAIGTSAFKGCINLSSIMLPTSLQYIDDEAFRNCNSLSYVRVLKETSPITNLGQNVFTGCDSNLEITVPLNRLIEYKNKEYWSSYRNKITSVGMFEEIHIDCETSGSTNINLQQGLNQCYKINVDCVKSYRISVISNSDVRIKLYNENMIYVNENTNMLDEYLNLGIYYVLFEYTNSTSSGFINVDFSFRWPNNFIQVSYNNNTNILSNLHNTTTNTKHGQFCYLNNQGEGLYKITLNAGNITYPVNTIKMYTDSNRTHLLDRYNNPEETIYATSQECENVMSVYLPTKGYYYIDVSLPISNYSSVTLKIEKVETNNLDYTTSLSNICFDVLFEVNSSFSNFEEIMISHRSKIQLDVITNGTITQNIKVLVFQKIKEPGSEPGDSHYYNVVKLEDYITTTNRSPVFDILFDEGTYYIGFINNSNHVSINMALRRVVNQDIDIYNTLVADPALNQDFTLGSEVTVNNGMCNSDTI
ncbi:MAG: leucine-rich repeat domain-containing protein, partial [Prevotella sp.]|nr:leucine-rich repeat domain-containing protein [Staphylococcus sp.]MCM1350916.1 leucine-rich repeat domain-containing protein [Prevotella sp.]